ncbi:hypothetical protein V6N11_080295 [Hibiscus sabdariffa]|uniref:Uncharacterized protein n=1 Tax=Hibiscus sabdariffa TaxID=183260 RepID=A0ABR2R7A6_9ROSI
MSSRGLKLVVPPEMQQNPCLKLNNGESLRGMPCGQQIILLLCLFCTFVCSAPQNAVAMQLTWVFPHVNRQLAQKSTFRLGQVQPLSFSFGCPLVHQCCSIDVLTILLKYCSISSFSVLVTTYMHITAKQHLSHAIPTLHKQKG